MYLAYACTYPLSFLDPYCPNGYNRFILFADTKSYANLTIASYNDTSP